MTNNVPDERLRAAATQFRDTWMRAGAVRVNDSRSSEITMLVDFARLREDSAMREAAGLVCAACVDTELYEPAALRQGKSHPSRWMHKVKDDGTFTYCAAGPIHERLALKGGAE